MYDKRIYLDYNATTPLCQLAKQKIVEGLEFWQNPSSAYSSGVLAKEQIELARVQVGKAIQASASDIIFTSGGTESNNAVINTAIEHFNLKHAQSSAAHLPHIVTTEIEHDSILAPLKKLQERAKCEVTYVPVASDSGAVRADMVAEACKDTTCLVTVMLANNETGVLQPVKEVVRKVKSKAAELGREILVHTDAAQALGKIPVDVQQLGIDYLTIVGHKFYGPRIGSLYARGLGTKKTPLYPSFYGGGQEYGYRPGTENTPMIMGLGAAAEFVSENLSIIGETLRNARDHLEISLKERLDSGEVIVNYESSLRLPNTSSIVFPKIQCTSSDLLRKCKTFFASTGAACHSNQIRPSKVLLACGLSEEFACRTVRLSLGMNTKAHHVDTAVNELTEFVKCTSQ